MNLTTQPVLSSSNRTSSPHATRVSAKPPGTPPLGGNSRAFVAPKPFIKWPGGKGQLVPALMQHIPKQFGVYHEPFVGGGALFFALKPASAVLSDANEKLIRTYRAVRDDPDGLLDWLNYAQVGHDRDGEAHYYETRDFFNGAFASCIAAAAAFVFLSKAGFNGLHRVNKQGEFNVPFGRNKNLKIYDDANIRACSAALRGTKLHHEGFEKVLDRAASGDVAYFDPPYQPTTKTSGFTEYTSDGFSFSDQERLRDVALELKKRDVHVVISNSATPEIISLYKKDFTITVVHAQRRINSKADARGKIPELIIT